MQRRRFLELAGTGFWSALVAPKLTVSAASSDTPETGWATPNDAEKYGAGHFGVWTRDSQLLPAYRYTCDQTRDPAAVSKTEKAWRSPTDHSHQVGNDRLVAVVSNYGYVQVRQDEGSPKFLNDYAPEEHRYGGGIGYLSDGKECLGTYYPGTASSFERTFGVGYFRKVVSNARYRVDQLIFAPFGDDPVLQSQVTITNLTKEATTPRWVEYWGVSNYQFSYRSLMEAALLGDAANVAKLRRNFAAQFSHHFNGLPGDLGLIDRQTFRGRSAEEEEAWRRVQDSLKANPNGFYGAPMPPLAVGSDMDDIAPPATFLVSLDAPADSFATNGAEFFEDGPKQPRGMAARLSRDLGANGPESAFLLERKIALKPGESCTLTFMYGYLPQGYELASLVSKYKTDLGSAWPRSCQQWKQASLRFAAEDEPWVERETTWSSYYLRSGLTYDSFFGEHILSQAGGYQYVAGLQGAARDPLQHVLPLIFTYPQAVREVIRYTLKETQPDGSLPYAIVGSGVPMPCRYRPSDLELWVLWVTSEYILATQDAAFLAERIPTYPRHTVQAGDRTIGEMLAHAYQRTTVGVGIGQHGLMRLFNGDWNDSIVVNRLDPPQVAETMQQGESVLNSAMAVYVLNRYATMLDQTQQPDAANAARIKAAEQRRAVSRQWTGRWFRRAWLGDNLGWSGDKQMWLEPQPWALISDIATPEQKQLLVGAINELMRKPSPIGAMLQSSPDPTMNDQPGVGTNGGVFAAINGMLIWALTGIDGAMAWDEWKKNSLARHAEAYPKLWYGIWSGPDTYNSAASKNPGETEPNFPVMNMHSHGWPLYSAIRMLGLEFHGEGFTLKPTLPLTQYEITSRLFGYRKSREGYAGWYEPSVAGKWKITLTLPRDQLSDLRELRVNGVTEPIQLENGVLHFSGSSSPGMPLRWQVRCDLRSAPHA